MKFRKQFNEREITSKDYETNTRPSQTIPDQSMSIKEILNRYARGLPITGQKVPLYDPENDLPDPRRLDLVEIQEYRDEFLEKMDIVNEEKSKAEKAKAEKKRQREIDDEIAKRNREAKKSQNDEKSTNNP